VIDQAFDISDVFVVIWTFEGKSLPRSQPNPLGLALLGSLIL
jgi:hypothetical protein